MERKYSEALSELTASMRHAGKLIRFSEQGARKLLHCINVMPH